jgi:hypothetical protein
MPLLVCRRNYCDPSKLDSEDKWLLLMSISYLVRGSQHFPSCLLKLHISRFLLFPVQSSLSLLSPSLIHLLILWSSLGYRNLYYRHILRLFKISIYLSRVVIAIIHFLNSSMVLCIIASFKSLYFLPQLGHYLSVNKCYSIDQTCVPSIS